MVPATAIGTYRASLLGSFGTLKAIRERDEPQHAACDSRNRGFGPSPLHVRSAVNPSTSPRADRHASVRRGIALAGYVHCDDGEDDRQTEQRRAEYAHNDGDQDRDDRWMADGGSSVLTRGSCHAPTLRADTCRAVRVGACQVLRHCR